MPRLHYVEARQAVEHGLVALIAVVDGTVGLFTYQPDPDCLAILKDGDDWTRVGGLLAFMEVAHRDMQEHL